MDTINIVRYDIRMQSELDEFEDIMHSLEFAYTTTHLILMGLQPGQIHEAINHAMKVCRLNSVDPAEHFRPLYVYDEHLHNTYGDWRMTRRGFLLVIMNARCINENIARWQWELSYF